MMTKISGFVLVLTLVSSFFSGVYAQIYNDGTLQRLPTPISRDLGRVAFSPHNLYTGQAGVDIPLYTLKLHDLEVPISISYDASGFIPNKAPSLVGLNWSLIAGGVITRKVNHIPDESKTPSGNAGGTGFFQRTANHTNAQVGQLTGLITGGFYNKSYELAPDLFVFNFCGRSGSFMMGQDGKFRFQGEETYYEEIEKSGLDFTLGGFNVGTYTGKFVLVDKSGVRYEFGGNSYAYEYTAEGDGNSNAVPMSWYLTRILAPEGYSIDFTYGSLLGPNSDFTVVNVSTSATATVRNVYLRTIQAKTSTGTVVETVSFVNGLRPVERSFSHYRNEQLNSIEIKDDALVVKKKFAFTYQDYLYESTRSRALLQSVGEVGLPAYQFTYYNTGYLSSAPQVEKSDFWGFYNNVTKPGTTAYGYNLYMEMVDPPWQWNPALEYTKTGILNTITHPTKGVTEYEYELHQYGGYARLPIYIGYSAFAYTPQEGTAGGLRVKKVTLKDQGQVLESREYKYKINYTPSGDGISSTGILYQLPNIYRTGLVPLPELAGVGEPHMTYKEVAEIFGDGGYRIHKFNSIEQFPDKAYDGGSPAGTYYGVIVPGPSPIAWNNYTIVNFFNRRSSLSLERGKPRLVTTYSNTGKKVSETSYVYNTDPLRYSSDTYKIVSAFFPVFGSPMPDLGFGINALVTTYESYFFPTKLSKQETTLFDAAGTTAVEKTTFLYDYNARRQVKTVTELKSNGDQERNKYKYVGDYPGLGATHALAKMQAKGILSPLVEQQRLVKSGGMTRLLDGSLTTYQEWVTGKVFRPANVKNLQLLAPSTDTTQSTVSGSSFIQHPGYASVVPEITFTAYDQEGNPLDSKNKQSTTPRSYIWNSKGQYPVAVIDNAPSSMVYHQDFEEPMVDFEANLVRDASRSHTGRYSGRIINSGVPEEVSHSSRYLTIDPTGPRKFTYSGWVYSTGPSTQIHLFMYKAGETGYFTYVDAAGTSVTNKWAYISKTFTLPADVVKVRLRLDNDGTGTVWFDDLRVHPSDASMTSYTYDPLVGITGTVDPRGNTAIYEYDSFGRLTGIKDLDGNYIQRFNYNYRTP